MNSLMIVSPAMVLCAGSILVLLVGLWFHSKKLLLGLSLLTLLGAAAAYVPMLGKPAQDAFAGLIVFDSFGTFFAVFSLVVTFIGIMISHQSAEVKSDRRAEYYSIVLALTSGLVFMAISNHFLMIYLAIETVSILSYTLAGFNKERTSSVEASMKYVVYGSMASAIMVFGMSLVYGITGSLSLIEIRQFLLATPEVPTLLWVAVLLVFAGIAYKISAAPMHMWTPDVYEGAPTPVAALLSVAPKAAGFALLIRFFVTGFSMPIDAAVPIADRGASLIGFSIVGPFDWPKILMISSVFTMFMGNLAALGQNSVKRILAYSSIAHAGYILMGAVVQTKAGIVAVGFYLALYCLMNMGAFWIASRVEDGYGGDQLKHFKGLGVRQPFDGAVMVIFLVSLIGLPPMAGFIGKFYLFSAVVSREMYGFAILAAVNSVISLYYYAKILRAMYLDAPEVESKNAERAFASPVAKVFLLALAVPTVVLGLYWEPLLRVVESATVIFVGKAP